MIMYVQESRATKTADAYTGIYFELSDDDLSRLFSHGYIELPISDSSGVVIQKIMVYLRGKRVVNLDSERRGKSVHSNDSE